MTLPPMARLEADGLLATDLRLNGELLAVTRAAGVIPAMQGRQVGGGTRPTVRLPGYSILWAVLKGATGRAACASKSASGA